MRVGYDAILFDLFGTLVDDAACAFPGAREQLAALDGFPWAIVTSCGRPMAESLIAHARLPAPPVLICAGDVERNKPAPDGYLLAARRLGVEPGRALVVEDSLQGIAAGRQAGMDVVAVLRGRAPAFARAATYVVDALADLAHLVAAPPNVPGPETTPAAASLALGRAARGAAGVPDASGCADRR